MKRHLVPLLAVLLVAVLAVPTLGSIVTGNSKSGFVAPPPGGGDPAFDFTYTSNDGSINIVGTLTATDNLDGTFTAVSGSAVETGTGVPAGYANLSLVPNPNGTGVYTTPDGKWNIDNQLQPSNANGYLISFYGLWFSNGSTGEVNLWGNGGSSNNYTYMDLANYNDDIRGTFTLTEVPEPATLIVWSLLGGLGMAIGCWRRKAA